MAMKPKITYLGSNMHNETQHDIAETPSGKDIAYENFPVGSWLLSKNLRPHIAMFYSFARAIDDIADNPKLTSVEKLHRLEGFESALLGRDVNNPSYKTAYRMRASLIETGVTSAHCIDLISAFKLDTIKLRYQTWDELMEYCILSAVPVGRYLVDLHGGSSDGYGPSDALCKALQVINHLQDCKDDFQTLDRVYLPRNWLIEANVDVQDLVKDSSSVGLRLVLDHCLKKTSALLIEAYKLPKGIKSRRLAMESAAIIEIAHRLILRLEKADPLGPKRINLTKIEYFYCCMKGVLRTWLPL
jgi:squalene synthase HpnC